MSTTLPTPAENVATMPLAAQQMSAYVAEMYTVELHCSADEISGTDELTAHAEAALLGIFEGFLKCLRVSGPRRAHLTNHYAQRMFHELAATTGSELKALAS
jgi:hypothetical protein